MKIIDCGSTVYVYQRTTDGQLDLSKARSPIVKLNANEYLTSDGIIKEFKHTQTKSENTHNIRRSYARMKMVINANVTDNDHVLFWTLTYQENMQDFKQVSKDMYQFLRRLKKSNMLPAFEYIYVKELQSRGSWHVHMISFHDSPVRPITKQQIADLWKQGKYTGQDCRGFSGSLNNLGQYLSPMFSYHGNTDEKALRLLGVQTGTHLWQCSRGIKRPVIYDLDLYHAQKFLAEKSGVLQSKKYFFSDTMGDTVIGIERCLYTDCCNGAEFDNSSYVKFRTTY